jgi:glucan phosphoethanolaminetransferase (alkaline phosphatase superfamily)
MMITLFMPLSIIQKGDLIYAFDVMGLATVNESAEQLYPTWGLFALTSVIALLALITIFLFKKRMLQIRLCVFNAILMIGFYALSAFYLVNLKVDLEAVLMVKIALSFPLVSLILNYLAIRSIGADEMLVRSLDRLR